MKKSLLFAGAIFLMSGIAIAETIDLNTPIKWNSNVVEHALNKSGFLGSYDAYRDVRVTHERILVELLKKDDFSIQDATRVCLDKCNMSDFLKNGRGESGKKCPELCSGFADTLVSVNNEYAKTGALYLDKDGLVSVQKDGSLKIFSADKQFYALWPGWENQHQTSIKKYYNICNPKGHGYALDNIPDAVVFETQTNVPVALLHEVGEDCAVQLVQACGVGSYELGIYENVFDEGFYVDFSSCCSEDCMPRYLVWPNKINVSNTGLVEKSSNGTIKVYSQDKKFYALVQTNVSKLYLDNKYANICDYEPYTNILAVIFDNDTKQPCAHMSGPAAIDAPLFINCAIKECKNRRFGLVLNDGREYMGHQKDVDNIVELEVKQDE